MTPGDDRRRPPKSEIRRSTGSETADLVSEVLKDAKHREEVRARRTVPVGRNRQKAAAISLPLAGAFSFYLWFGQPAWVTPNLPPPSTETAEAGLRVAMFFEAQKIEGFRNQSGRLPDALAELGGTPPAEMTYERIDARTYRLVGQSRGVRLTFNSDEAIQQFVGDALDRLGIGPGR